jgi:opacity protein-like surface antigen
MNTTRIKILTSALVLAGSTSTLHAEDLGGKTYLGFDAGLALQQNITLRNGDGDRTRATFEPGFRFDVTLGSHLSDSWSLEGEIGLIYNSFDKGIIGGDSVSSSSLFEIPLMVNGLYKLPLHGPVTAFVGAGIGGVYSVFSGGPFGAFGLPATDLSFGYQGTAGVKYAISDKWELGIAYKFLDTTEHDLGWIKADGTMTHSFLATLTFKF